MKTPLKVEGDGIKKFWKLWLCSATQFAHLSFTTSSGKYIFLPQQKLELIFETVICEQIHPPHSIDPIYNFVILNILITLELDILG